MAVEPHDRAVPQSVVVPLGASAPRAYRTTRAAGLRDGSPDADVTRHLVLAREALPPDPRDAIAPTSPPVPLPRASEDVGEDERLDPRSETSPPHRAFRTRAPVALAPRSSRPPGADALLGALREMQVELDIGQARLRRIGEALDRIDALGVAAQAPGVAPQAPTRVPASGPSERMAGHSVAIEMAVSGFSRGEVGALLERHHDVRDVAGVLDEVFGARSGPDARIPL